MMSMSQDRMMSMRQDRMMAAVPISWQNNLGGVMFTTSKTHTFIGVRVILMMIT